MISSHSIRRVRTIVLFDTHLDFDLQFPYPEERLDQFQLEDLVRQLINLIGTRNFEEIYFLVEKELILIKKEKNMDDFTDYVREMDSSVHLSLFEKTEKIAGNFERLPENFKMFFEEMLCKFKAMRWFLGGLHFDPLFFPKTTYRYRPLDLKEVFKTYNFDCGKTIISACDSLDLVKLHAKRFGGVFGVNFFSSVHKAILDLQSFHNLILESPPVTDLQKIPSLWFIHWAILFCQKGVDFLVFSNIFNRVGVFWDCLDQKKALTAYQNIQKSHNKRSRMI